MTELIARDVRVAVGRRQVLDQVNIRLAPGELVGLLGPNGAGKSTLMKALAGLLPCRGVQLDGYPLDRLKPAERARRIAYLPQGAEAHWPVLCREVVALGRMPHRTPPRHDRAVIRRVLEEVDALHLAQRPFDTLSGGERARILLARALAVEAPVLLADEPIAHLDPCHQLRVLDLLRRRAAEGDGVMVVLHDLSLAAGRCDRLYVLHQGRVAAEGVPAQVLDDPLLARVFGIRAWRGQAERPVLVPWEVMP
ncbi:MAG: ABC transporter ATP-binding protein [Magnetospirillum sp.]|nr:ABC transporter ATP-binding protein [Magnetospirillum sp.]